MGNFMSKSDYHYQTIRANVDMLKVIQLGITLWTADGELPPQQLDLPLGRANNYNSLSTPCTWQFNFKFSLEDDMYAEDAVALLKKSGVDFEKAAESGIDPTIFGSLLITSGLVTDRNVTWVSFHSGYDFGYLVKIMFPAQLPENEDSWLEFVRTFFPRIWDIKFLFRHAQRLAQRGVLNQQGTAIMNAMGTRSSLQDLADELGCSRVGQSHTAGSDAWLTGLTFWQLKQKLYSGTIQEEHNGQIWGINNVGPPASASSQAAAIAGGHSTPSTNGASLFGMTGMTPTGYNDGGPSTPQQTSQSTPGGRPGMYGGQGGQMMPGGAFANFQYGGR
jgi:CCR4-NOT transcription complex subunit 7/8